MKAGNLGDSCAIEMYISKNCLCMYMLFFCPKQGKSVSFQMDKTDYVLYLLEVCLLIQLQGVGDYDLWPYVVQENLSFSVVIG